MGATAGHEAARPEHPFPDAAEGGECGRLHLVPGQRGLQVGLVSRSLSHVFTHFMYLAFYNIYLLGVT